MKADGEVAIELEEYSGDSSALIETFALGI